MLLGVLRSGWLAVTVVSLVVGIAASWPVDWFLLGVPVAFGAVGLLLSVKRPRNPVGWFLGGQAATTSLLFGAQSVAAARVPESVANWSAWLGTWPISFSVIFLVLPIVFFPDGRLPSRWWRIPVIAIIAVSLGNAVVAFLGDFLFTRNYPKLHDPVQLLPRDVALAIGGPLETFQLFGILVAAAAVFVRFRRSRGIERQQLKWFLYTVSIAAVAMAALASLPLGVEPVLAFEFFAPLIPIAVAVAILRYRLYDIDRLVSRTVSWLLVSALLTAVYLVTVIVLTRAVALSSSLGVAASTLAAAALFQPVRRRVQDVVDRRFNRARFDAARTAEGFAVRARNDVELETLCNDLLSVVRTTIAPAHAALWLSSDRPNARRIAR